MSDTVDVEYDLNGGMLFAAQHVGGAPEGVSFGFTLVATLDGKEWESPSDPPKPKVDNVLGRAYRIPARLAVPMSVPEVLAKLNGVVVESVVAARSGNDVDPTATLVLLQEMDGQRVERGGARADFQMLAGGTGVAVPRVRLIGRDGL
jgi:hypothetical protein